MPGIFEELVAGIRARGFEVLLAHPELSPTLQRDPARLERLVEQGCRLQLTSRSLLRPERRSRIRRLAEQALEAGWASVLASDAHAVEWRPPELGSHVAQIADRHPHLAAELRWMVSDVPRALIEDATVPPRPPRTGERPRRGFWRRD
jgi:protein-tyrosine phosphatase